MPMNAPAPATPGITSHDKDLWPLATVLDNFPVSRSAWLNGIKQGRFPAPVYLSPRKFCWRSADVRALINSL